MSLPLPKPAGLVAGLVLALSLSITSAAAMPLGQATVVSPSADASQGAPEIAINATGASVIVWHDSRAAAVFARRFAADGSAIGEAILVDARPDNRRDLLPDVALADDGRFVVAWQRVNAGLPEGPIQNLIRRFAADGTALEPARELDRAGAMQRIGAPSLAGDGSGNHAVVWSRLTTTPPRSTSLLPRFETRIVDGVEALLIEHRAADGSLRTPQQAVETIDTADRVSTFRIGVVNGFRSSERGYTGYDVAMSAVGETAVTWSDERYYDSGNLVITAGALLASRTVNLYARRYGLNASAVGNRITVDSLTAVGTLPTRRSAPRVAIDRAGAMTVVWSDVPTVLGLTDRAPAYARRIEADGRKRLAARIGDTQLSLVLPPAVAAFDDGRAIAALTRGGAADLLTQGIAANGRADGEPNQVAAAAGVVSIPAIAARGDGSHIVVWASGGLIRQRRFGPP